MSEPTDLEHYYYRMFDVTLDTGRVITLRNLNQGRTYENQLEGLPRYIPERAEMVRERFEKKSFFPVILLDARPFPIPLSVEEARYLRDHPPYAKGAFQSFAPVICEALFISEPLAGGEAWDYSLLGMVWYQETFGPPEDPLILEKIRALDWEALAKNFEL